MRNDVAVEETPKLETEERRARSEPEREVNWRLIIRLSIAALVALAFLSFVFQNTERTEIEFLGWSFSAPLSLIIIGSAVAGVVIWHLAGWLSRRRKKK